MGIFLLILRVIIISILFIIFSSSIKKDKQPPIELLFYQPLLKDQIEWNDSFKKINKCQINKVILQWSRFGVVDFLKDDKWLIGILKNAQKYNIKIVIGLYGDDKYFKKLEDKRTNIKKYFEELKKINIFQAQKAYSIAKNYSSFDGWYIYDEIDDTNFIEKNRQIYLKEYLQYISNKLEKISPKPLYISSYFSNKTSPQKYVNMILETTQNRYKILVQSGIGANLVSTQKSIEYMQEFSKKNNIEFIPIVESFKFIDSEFRPIDFISLQKQIKQLQNSSKTDKIALFSLRYFFAKEILKEYQYYYNTPKSCTLLHF